MIITSIINFFKDTANLITQLKDFIVDFFDFLKDSLYLIPQPFSTVLQTVISILIVIFIVKIVGDLL